VTLLQTFLLISSRKFRTSLGLSVVFTKHIQLYFVYEFNGNWVGPLIVRCVYLSLPALLAVYSGEIGSNSFSLFNVLYDSIVARDDVKTYMILC
jgi:hypothetical protein